MEYRKYLPNLVLSIGVVCLAITTIVGLTQRGTRASRKQQVIPKIISKVKTLEVVGVYVDNRNEETAVIVIEVRNNSEKPIVALAVESGNEKDSSGVSTNGFRNGDEPPAVILEPHETLKVRMPLSYVWPGTPVKVGAVMYLDGTEEGDEVTLGTLRRQKAHKKESKKGSASQP